MGCGLGGCYSCVVPVKHGHEEANLVRSCISGPVFDGAELVWDEVTPDLSVAIGSLTLPNPVIAASGCFGYGVEYEHVVDLSLLGGIVSKGLFMKERQGHPPPRIVETPAGMINAIGLQGIGVHRFVKEKLPVLREPAAPARSSTCAARRSRSTSRSARCCRRPKGWRRSSSTSRAPTSRKAASSSGAASTARSMSSARSGRPHTCRSFRSSRRT